MNSRATRAPRFGAIVVGDAVVLVTYGAIPALFALAVVIDDPVAFPRAYQSTAGALAGVEEQFYPAAGIIATVLLSLVAATEFGRSTWRLRARTRRLLIAATAVASLVVVGLITVTATRVLAGVSPVSAGALELVVGVLLLLVSHLVVGVASRRRRERTARRARRRRAQRARALKISSTDVVSTARVCRAEVVAWVVPLAWSFLLVDAVGTVTVAPAYAGVVALVAALQLFAPLLVLLGWRATADLSSSPSVRWAIRSTFAAAGAAASIAFAVGLLVGGLSWWWALSLVVATGVIVGVVLPPGPNRVFLSLGQVERAATVRTMRILDPTPTALDRPQDDVAAASVTR